MEVGFEVIGHGVMPTKPMQIGEWWVVPADQYDSTIPPEAYKKLNALINRGIKIKGVFVADDIKKIKAKEEKERKKKEAVEQVAGTFLEILGTVAMAIGYLFVMAFSFDPMLVAVLEDGSYVCLYSWYD